MDSPFSITRPSPFRRAIEANREAEIAKQREIEAQQPEAQGPTLSDEINRIAVETQIPANILMAVSEASGATAPNDIILGATAAGNKLSGAVRGGLSVEDALREAVGDDAISGAILERAKGWADTFDPLGPLADRNRPEDGNVWRDLPAGVVGSLASGIGDAGQFVGEQLDTAIDTTADVLVNRPLQAVTGNPDLALPKSGGVQAIGRGVDYVAGGIGDWVDQNFVSKEAAQAGRDTGFEGNLLEPSTWGIKDNSSTRGFLQQGAQIVGSMLPAFMSRNPSIALGTGAALGGGAGAEQADQFIDELASEITKGGASTRLQDESQTYRDARASGMDHAGALAETKRQARILAGAPAAAVGAFGGLATQRIVRAGEHIAAKSGSRLGRGIGGAITSGAEEGVQEVAEGAAAGLGANLGAGTNAPVMDDSLNDFMLGAMGGAAPGAVSGLASSAPRSLDLVGEPIDAEPTPTMLALPAPAIQAGGRGPFDGFPLQDPPIAQQPANFRPSEGPAAGPAPLGLPAPAASGPMVLTDPILKPQLPSPTGPSSTPPASLGALVMPGTVAPPAPPKGPLAGARDLAPAPLFTGLKSGQQAQIVLRDKPNAPIYATLIEETAMGLTFDDAVTGERHTVPREEIERGDVSVRFADPNVREAGSMQPAPLRRPDAAQPPAPQPASPAAIAPDAPQQGPVLPFGAPDELVKPAKLPQQRGIEDVPQETNAIDGPALELDQPVAPDQRPGELPPALPAGDVAAAGGAEAAPDGDTQQPAVGELADVVEPGDGAPADIGRDAPAAPPAADAGNGADLAGGVSAANPAGEQPADLTEAKYHPDQPGTKETMRRDHPPPAIYGKGEVLTTGSGRETSPFPHIKTGTPARYRNNVKRVNDWFMAEALAEARARGDDFAARSFEQDQGKGDKTPQASLEMAAMYLDMQRQPIAEPAGGQAKTGKSSRKVKSNAGAETDAAEQNSAMASASENDVPKVAQKTPMTKDQLYKPQPKAEQDATEDWWLEQIPAQRAATLVAVGWKGDDDMIDALSRYEGWDELGPTIRLALTNIRLFVSKPAEDAPKAEEKPEPKADTAPIGKKPLAEAVPGSVKHGKTGPETGVLLADQAYAFIKSHMEEGEPRTAGMSLSYEFGDGVRGPMSFAFDEDNSYKDRYAKPKGKVFVRGPNGLHSFWFTVADIDAEIERAKPAQGKSELPGGVAEGEERAEDQGGAKIAVIKARDRAKELADEAATKRFTLDHRKPISAELAKAATEYLDANPAPAKPAVTLPSALEADIRRIVGSKTAQSQQHYVGRYDVIVTDRGVMVYRGGEEVAGLGKITKNPDEAIEAMRSLVALDAPAPAKQPPAQVDDAGEKVGTVPGTVPTNDAAAIDMAEVGKKWNKLRGPSKKMMLGLAGFEGEAADALREKSWADIDADTQAKLADAMEGKKTGEKLADFGAEISDSRKLRAKSMMESMFAGQMPVAGEFVGKPLATVWPEPDYAALVASGVEPRKAAALAMLRNYDADKPRRQYRLRIWADNMVKRMDAAKQVADGADHAQFFKKLLGEGADAALEIIEGGDVARMGDLSRIKVLTGVSRRDYDVPLKQPGAFTTDNLSIIMPWMKARGGIGLTFGTSEPVEVMRAGILRLWDQRRERMAASRGESGDKKVALSTASKPVGRGVSVYVIVADFGRGPVEIYGEFADQAEAKAYLDENKADLEDSAREMRLMRNEEWLRDPPARKSPVEWRTGDVSIKLFADTFGIDLEGQGGAGVQFGQSTLSSNKEAQDRLNQVYDAFMDMAAVLGLPPKAMFLNGKLRLALGARGKGGRNPAAAHHETDRGIINLTRASGAGTLSHEWFHAIDNLIVREAEAAAAADPKVSKWNTYDRRTSKADVNNRYATATDIEYRPLPAKLERAQKAADALRRALRKNSGTDGWITRADRLDKLRGDKPYFNTAIELAARAFERVVFDRLAERGLTNGFLVGIDTESGAYPTPRELQRDGVAAAMGELIEAARDLLADEAAADTIETKSLPEIDLTYGYVGPKVGMSWEGEDGKTRRILSSKPDSVMGDLFTVDLGNGREEVMRAEAIERLIDTDEAATDPEAQARKGVRDTAKQKKDDAQAAREALLNLLKEDARRIITDNATGPDRQKLLDELKYGDARVYLSGQNVQEAVPLALSMFRDGYRVQESRASVRNKVRNVLGIRDKEGFGWNEVGNDGKRILPPAFIRMMQLLADVEARKKRAEDPNPPKEMTEDELDQLFGPRPTPEPEPDPTPEPEAPQPEPAPEPEPTPEPVQDRADDMGLLSKAEKDRLAALRDKFRSKIKTQLNSGLDPELVAVAAEMAAIYIKAGARKFRDLVRAMVEDLEMPFESIQPYARSAYNQVRGDMELADQNIDGMDDDKAVIAEIRAIRAEEKQKAEGADLAPKPQQDGEANEPQGDRGGNPEGLDEGGPEGGEGSEVDDAPAGGIGPRGNGGGGAGGNGGNRDEPQGGMGGGGERVPPAAEQVTGENPGNYRLTDADNIGSGSDGAKIKANIAAIRIIKAIEAENRYPTKEEQADLAKYVGWGGLKTVFDPKKEGVADQYGRAQAELRELLTKPEYEAAFDSVKNAHYTAPEVVRAMWKAMQSFGFTGGRALEPTVGVGNFIGFQPDDLASDTEWHGAELDSITGRIAAALYPDANIMPATGFENAAFARGVFDIAIGNPPFGQETIARGREKDLLGLKIHNYIIAKTGRHLRPGGIMAMVVTHRFLDTHNAEARDRLAQDFRFMGAIRLPNDAFLANAGTEVVTDIVFLQKLKAGENPDLEASWLDTNGKLDGDIRVNRYFAENPQNILGRSAMDGTMYAGGAERRSEYTVHSDGRDLSAAIDGVIEGSLAQFRGALGSRTEALEAAVAVEEVSTLALGQMMLDEKGQVIIREDDGPNGEHRTSVVTEESYWKDDAQAWGGLADAIEAVKESMAGGLIPSFDVWDSLQDAAAFLYVGGAARREKAKPTQAEAAIYALAGGDKPLKWGKVQKDALSAAKKARDDRKLGADNFANVKSQLKLRQAMLSLIRSERADAESASIEKMRGDLRKAYVAYQKKHGFLNSSRNRSVMRDDQGPEMGLEASYQPKADGQEEQAEQAAILSKRVYFPYKEAESADTPADGLVISISERGRVDIPFIAALTGMDIEEVISALTDAENPRIFMDPDAAEYVDAESYLSGNVKLKLRTARDEGLEANVKALEKVQPEPMTKDRIVPVPRSLWIPAEIYTEFLNDMGATGSVVIHEEAGTISVNAALRTKESDFGMTFRHDDADVVAIFTSVVSAKPMKIYKGRGDDRYLDEVATREVNAIGERMAREFEKWAYQNSERTQKIVDAFNEKMNTHVERKFDGVKYLKTVGMNPSLHLRNSQKNGAWRMMISETSLMHHIVGAGKTFTAITAVMERRRMNLSRKPMIAVPNHLVGQWAADFRFAYPGAKILAATSDDFEKSRRRRLFSRIATGDYDAIIVGHSSLGFIENNPDDTQRIITEQLDALKELLERARVDGTSRRTLTQIRNAIKKYEDKIRKLQEKAESRADEIGINFRDMGIDYLVVDEAHEFKNLEYQSSADRLVGMNDPKGSQKAFNLYVKTRTLLDDNESENARNGVGFLTGTPISNSLVEAYSMMKYLAPKALRDRGIAHFDAWSGAYVQAETRFEYNATQKLVERRVMSRLVNLTSLSQLYREFADVILTDQLHEIYADQIRAENKATGGSKSEKFPVPKVKDGGRQLDSAPASKEQVEYTDYLAARMLGMKSAPDKKEYARIDNQLWVLSDARKASIDIRTVDPDQPRDEASKVSRASEKIYAKWQESSKVKGTQLIFSDLSTPKKAARTTATSYLVAGLVKAKRGNAKDARALANKWAEERESLTDKWEGIIQDIQRIVDDIDTADDERDALNDWLEANNSADAFAAMQTFDTGFSVYDDMRASLIEKGIPAEQIAFIHDFDTDKAKAKLFADVNSGRVRILIGSTPKMGAGTNVQQRLVALHHMDSPWRPSDVEQREGRIIRAGNKLYEDDPEGFEVDIWAYSTEGTSDVVLWQVLERKARAIEQFLSGALDTMEDEDADSDKYAEFMAQSTGNPVFLRKLETERNLLLAESDVAGLLMSRTEAKNFLETYDTRRETSVQMADFAKEVQEKGLTAAQIRGSSAPPADPADLEPALNAYREEYFAAMRANEAEIAAIEAENAALKAQGKRQKAIPKLEMAPPSVMAPGVREKSSYARLIVTALEQSRRLSPDQRLVIQFNGSSDVTLSIARSASAIDPRKSDFIVQLEYSNAAIRKWRSSGMRHVMANSRVIDPTSSANLIAAFSTGRVMSHFKGEQEYYEARVQKLEEERPEMERRSKMEVDTGKVADLKSLLAFYKADVSIAEARREFEVKGRPANRYIAMDTIPGRIFGSDSGQLIEESITFEVKEGGAFDGTYEGTGIGASKAFTSRGNDPHHGVFEAVNPATGTRAIFEASTFDDSGNVMSGGVADGDITDKSGKWAVLGMMVDPHSGKADKPNTSLLTKDRRADAEIAGVKDLSPARNLTQRKATAERLREEMKRLGIARRVYVELETFATSQFGHSVMGQFTMAGKDAGRIKVSTGFGGPEQALGTLRHEVIHALRSPEIWDGAEFGLFTREEWTALVRAARNDRDVRAWVRRNYAGASAALQTEEAVSEYFSRWAATQDNLKSGPLQSALVKIRDMILALARAVVPWAAPKLTGAEVARAIMSGKIGGRGPDGPGNGFVMSDRLRKEAQELIDSGQFTKEQVESELGVRMRKADLGFGRGLDIKPGRGVKETGEDFAKWGKTVTQHSLTQAMSGNYNLLALVPGRGLYEELGRNMLSAQAYLKTKGLMDTMRNEMTSETDKLAQKWLKLAGWRGTGKHNEALMDIMHRSTIWQTDPTKAFAAIATEKEEELAAMVSGEPKNADEARALRAVRHDKARRVQHAAMQAEFNALPANFKAMYAEVRDAYSAMQKKYDEVLKGNIDKVAAITAKRAERTFEKKMQQIEDDGDLTAVERKEAIEAAERVRDRTISTAKQGAAARSIKMRQLFEANRLQGPYFPLSRFGDFFVTVRDKQGNVVRFSRFEKRWQQEEAAEAERKAGNRVETGVLRDANARRNQVDPRFVAEVEGILAGADVPKEAMDAIWQRWLETLPEVSVRKNRIHRKGTEGFQRDALRAFSYNMFHSGHQLARLKYGLELQDHLDEAYLEAARQPDANRAGLIVREMEKRHEFAMNPTGGAVANMATSASFIWYLGMTPAAALVNLSQTTMIGIPVLSNLHKGSGSAMVAAADEIQKAARQFLQGKGAVEKNPNLTDDERKAIRAAYDMGTIDRSQAHDLAGLAESGVAYSPIRTKVMGYISFMFHHTERMNREVTFMAAYRLARKGGAAHEAAVDMAADATWKTHFDYANSSRPRIMQNDAAKVLLVFRNYQVNMIWRLFRDLHQAFKGEDEATRKEARRQLFGITGMMMLHAGISGTWLFGITMMIAGLFFGGGADEAEAEFKSAIVDTLGPTLGGALWYGTLGQASGIDMTSRIGMPDLWFRSPDKELEGEDAYNYWLGEVVGAFPGIAESMFRGVELVGDGNYWRGAEAMVPKAARDLLRAGRYATQGVETTKGDPILEEASALDVLRQAAGFTPARVAERYDVNSYLKNREAAIMTRRQKAMAGAAQAIMAGEDIPESVNEEIARFNADFPEYPITAKSLRQSVKSRIRMRDRSEFGISLNPKLNDRIRGEAPPIVSE